MMDRIRDFVMQRRRAYRRLFLGDAGKPGRDAETVLTDLARFCRAGCSSVPSSMDPIAMAVAEGRREVWLRIQAHLHLDDAVVMNLKENVENDD